MGQTLYEASRESFTRTQIKKLDSKIEFYRNNIEMRDLILEMSSEEITAFRRIIDVLKTKVKSLVDERDTLKNVL